MNMPQKAVILLGIAIILLLGLYPPWIHTYSLDKGQSKEERASIYALIFKPPEEPFRAEFYKYLANSDLDQEARRKEFSRFNDNYRWSVLLDTPRLLVQWAMVIITVVGLCLVLNKNK